jgi:hypothetical protein
LVLKIFHFDLGAFEALLKAGGRRSPVGTRFAVLLMTALNVVLHISRKKCTLLTLMPHLENIVEVH